MRFAKGEPRGFAFPLSATRFFALATSLLSAFCASVRKSAALAASPTHFQANDTNVKTLLPGNFRFQTLEQRASEFFDPSALETCEVDVIDIRLGLVEVLLTIQMHQVEFINQPEPLEKINRSVHRCTIDLPVALARQCQQRCSIQVTV